jgi:site-specific DNA recombinase
MKRNIKEKQNKQPVALVYCRVSTEDQIDNTSLDGQEMRCREYAAKNGYIVAKVVKEAHTGKELQNRPLISEVRREIKQGFYDAIIVDKLDRLARDETHQSVLLYEIEEEAEMNFHTVSEDFDNSRIGRFLRMILGFFAAFERERITERNVEGKRMRAIQGKIVGAGTDLYGYTLNRETRKREIKPNEAAIVRRIFESVLNGKSRRSIIKELNSEGIPSPAQDKRKWKDRRKQTYWGSGSMGRILSETAYYGESYAWKYKAAKTWKETFRDKNEWIKLPDDATPPIITKEIFDAVQAKLRKNSENHSNANKSRNEKIPFLLRGLIYCSCGQKLRPETDNRSKLKNAYYRCSSRATPHGSCGAKQIRADFAETVVWDKLREIVINPQIVEGFLKERQETGNYEKMRLEGELNSTRRVCQKEEAEYQKMMRNALMMDDPGGFKPFLDEKKRLVDSLKKEVEKAEARITDFEAAQANLNSLRVFCDRAAENIQTLDFAGKRDLLEIFECKVTADEGKLTLEIGVNYENMVLSTQHSHDRQSRIGQNDARQTTADDSAAARI